MARVTQVTGEVAYSFGYGLSPLWRPVPGTFTRVTFCKFLKSKAPAGTYNPRY